MGIRGIYCSLALVLALTTAQACGAVAAGTGGNTDTRGYLARIGVEALAFLEESLRAQSPDDDLEIELRTPDPRLHLRECANPLTYELHGNANNASNVTLRVRCEAGQAWSFYLTAQVERWRKVVVARHAIGRGALLSGADIELQRRHLGNSAAGVVSRLDAVAGKQARRPIQAGEIIRQPQLEEPLAVARGDVVKVRAAGTDFAVVTRGEALSAGRVGDQIRVRNQRSERIIRARIIAAGEVEVLL